MKKLIVKYCDVEIKLDSELEIKNLSIEIYKGEFVYLIGKTGSGKSSILKSMYAEKKIINGEAFVSDINLRTINDKKIPFLRRKIGIIFQDFQLLNDRNIYKNLEFVLKATGWSDKFKINERIKFCLEKVHILNLADKLPGKLSGWQKQRISIERAILKKSPIILLDEATSSLDADSEEIVQLAINNLTKNKTTIVIAHRLSTIHNAEVIFVLKNGEVIDSGNHDFLMNNCKEYKSLYQKQLK